MLERVEEAVGGPDMKPLHDKLKKMQVVLLSDPSIPLGCIGARGLLCDEGSC